MKTNSDSIFTEEDPFIIVDTSTELSTAEPVKVRGWGIFLCTSGTCTVNINTEIYSIRPGSEMLLFPEAFVCFSNCSPDLKITIFTCSDAMMLQALRKISSDFFRHLRKYPVYQHNGSTQSVTEPYFAVFRTIFSDRLNKYRTIIATNVLRSLCCTYMTRLRDIRSTVTRKRPSAGERKSTKIS